MIGWGVMNVKWDGIVTRALVDLAKSLLGYGSYSVRQSSNELCC